LKRSFKYSIKVVLATWLLRFLYRSGKYNITGEHIIDNYDKEGKSVLIAIWHGQLLTAFMRYAFRGYVALAGTHKDASLIADIGEQMNWSFVRGSSSEGGTAALKSMIKVLKQPGTIFLITPDGPKGPPHIVKPGVIKAAQLAGIPIVPAAGQATRRWVFQNWDAFYTAKPFSKIELHFGDPIFIDKNDDTLKAADALTNELNRLTEIVEEKCNA